MEFMQQEAQIGEPIAKVICPSCESESKRFGRHRNGLQRYRCLACHKTFTEDHEPAFRIEDYLNTEQGRMALKLLLEGTSVRSAERLTGLHRDAILRLLIVAGERCEALMDRLIRNVPCTEIQCDEIWGYVGKKEGHKRPDEYENDSIGDAWTWVALERNTKLVLAFAVGRRSLDKAFELTLKLRRATSQHYRFQLTTDGLKAYRTAVDEMLADRCDFAQLIKFYSQPVQNEQRYSPPRMIEAVPVAVSGDPEPSRICTSHVERQNLTMRMQIRRLTRLTNAFSKKLENHRAAMALHFAYYNFCRIHSSIRITPAMQGGVTDHVWDLAELLS
jgi:transposase-like protein/IS1 family transposase